MIRSRPVLAALCLCAALLPLAAVPARADAGESVPALIDQAAADYHVSPYLMHAIAHCESRHSRWAFNRHSGASGVYQWLPSSFAEVAPQAGYAGASVWNAEANVRTAAWAISRGQAWRWRACL